MGTDADPVLLRAYGRVGSILRNKWRLDRLLGVGGMASVYLATHRNGARGAVKILHPELAIDRGIRARFLKEGYAANLVGHPGAVAVLDDDEADGSVFLVMELLEGESLERRCQRGGGRLQVEEVLALTDQLLDVLVAAHNKQIVHRDLKPENLFLTNSGQVKVLDFGIARLFDDPSRTGATQSGMSMGTPWFMPPEQAKGEWSLVDGRSDIWAVGATMYALLVGRPVHEAATANQVLLAAMTKSAPPLRSVLPGCPIAVAALVDRALAFDKYMRWPDARTMQDALREAYYSHRGSPITTAPRMTVPQRALDDEDEPTKLVLDTTARAALVAAASAAPKQSFTPTPALPVTVAPTPRWVSIVLFTALLLACGGVGFVGATFARDRDAGPHGEPFGVAATSPSATVQTPSTATASATASPAISAPEVLPTVVALPADPPPDDGKKKSKKDATKTAPVSPQAPPAAKRPTGPMVNDL